PMANEVTKAKSPRALTAINKPLAPIAPALEFGNRLWSTGYRRVIFSHAANTHQPWDPNRGGVMVRVAPRPMGRQVFENKRRFGFVENATNCAGIPKNFASDGPGGSASFNSADNRRLIG